MTSSYSIRCISRAPILLLALLVSSSAAASGAAAQASGATTTAGSVKQPEVGPRDTRPLRVGERVRGVTLAGQSVSGWVLTMQDSGITVGRRPHAWSGQGGSSTAVRYEDLVGLEARRPPAWRSKAVAGGVTVGVLAGAVIGSARVNSSCESDTATLGPCINRGEAGMIGAVLGATLGGLVATIASYPRWHTLSLRRSAP